MTQVLVVHSDAAFALSLTDPFDEAGLVPHLVGKADQAMSVLLSDSPDAVVIEAAQGDWLGLRTCEEIKRVTALAHVVLIALFPREGFPDDVPIDWDDPPFDDFMIGPPPPHTLTRRLRMNLSRHRRHLEANPLTRLPGNSSIILELERRMGEGEEFAVCYADLDNFKAFNDKYGFSRGDEALKMTARLLTKIIGRLGHGRGFVGHLGGDDFVFIVPANRAASTAGQIVDHFDRMIGSLYDPEDRNRGHIVSTNRQGEPEIFPLMGISVAVIPNRRRRLTHLGQISAIAADLKSHAKLAEGSTVVIDRRRTAPEEE